MARYDKYHIQWNKDQLQPIPFWLTINKWKVIRFILKNI